MKQLAKEKERELKQLEKQKLKEEHRKAKEKLNLEAGIAPEEVLPTIEPDRTSSDHFDFGLILSKFTSLKVLSLVYELQETGLDWEPRLFVFTDVDCINLANGNKRGETESLIILKMSVHNSMRLTTKLIT